MEYVFAKCVRPHRTFWNRLLFSIARSRASRISIESDRPIVIWEISPGKKTIYTYTRGMEEIKEELTK